MALLKKLEQLFLSHAFGGQKVVANFSNKPLNPNFILKNNLHITFSKVINNLMMLYIGTPVGGSFSFSFEDIFHTPICLFQFLKALAV